MKKRKNVIKELNKQQTQKVLNLLNIVADNRPLSCNRCGVRSTCPLQELTKKERAMCRIEDRRWDSKLGVYTDSVRKCFQHIMKEVSNRIIKDYMEVRIG